MISDILLGFCVLIVTPINALMPHISLPAFFVSNPVTSGVTTTMGAALAPLRTVLPLDAMLTVFGDILSLWPALVGYLLVSWVWRHMPTIAGFGLGEG